MKWLRHVKIGMCLAVLVAASGLTGGLIGRRLARHQLAQRSDPETWHEAAARTFERTVRPTPEQRERIGACLDAAVAELKTVRAETIARSSNVVWRLVGQVEKELTPEQRTLFQAMKPTPGELRSLDMLKVEPAEK